MTTAVLERETARQQSILDALPILADVLRSDVLYYQGTSPEQLMVIAHAQPHSTHSVYSDNKKGQAFSALKNSLLARAIRYGTHSDRPLNISGNGAEPVHQEVYPVRDHHGAIAGALSIETHMDEYQRLRRRNRHLTRALKLFKQAVAAGAVRGAQHLTPFTSRDGLVVVRRDMQIEFVSNIADALYQKLNITQSLVGRSIDLLETGDENLIAQAFREKLCLEREEPVREAVWLRKVIPLAPRADDSAEPALALLLLRDVTQERAQEHEQARLEAMIREIHHRVKNNLQTIISLARMDARSAQSAETQRVLEELINRIFAVAQVHESLSADYADIPLKDVSRQIVRQVRDSLMPADSRISIDVEGDALRLPPRQATACVLIINELVQNAVEHAFAPGETGYIRVQLEDTPERVRITVVDSGRGLPEGFDWRRSDSLGLKIVNSFARDLRGEFTLSAQPPPAHGARAQLTLSRMLPGGQ